MKRVLKWTAWALLGLLILVAALLAYVMATALDSEHPVGFQITQTKRPDGKPIAVGVWYPTQARAWPTTLASLQMKVADGAPVAGQGLPLVLISHGNGAGSTSHADLAMALASAGDVVAAPMPGGDNFADQSAVGKPGWLGGRVQYLRSTLDHLLKQWPGRSHIDPARIGAYGFSAGGFTVLSVIGAQPDLRLIAQHCAAATDEFACKLLAHSRSPLLSAGTPWMSEQFSSDPRIRAAVVAAPGLGFAFKPESLAALKLPLQLWSAEQDDVVPLASNGLLLRQALGARLDFHSVPGAAHYAFLAPCSGLLKLLAPPLLCEDPAQFDRHAFHRDMNAKLRTFFDARLPKPAGP